MRLIDADALDMYERLKSYYGDAWRDAQEEIDAQPTVNAVPVIRCKDCKHMHEDGVESYCDDSGRYIDGTGFCKWAERKDKNDSCQSV